MRYSTLPPFFRHLTEAAPHHLAPVYAIFCSDPEEGRYLAKAVLKKVGKSFSKVTSLSALKTVWNQQTLFSPSEVFWLDTPKVSKKEAPLLKQLLLSGSSMLLITSQEDHLGRFFEEKGVLLTFFPEKKWTREKRFCLYLQEQAKKRGKVIEQSALQELLLRSGLELEQLFSDLDKVCTYIGKKKMVEKGDVATMLVPLCAKTLWEKAEKFVWEKQYQLIDKPDHPLFLHAVRKQFHMGYLLAGFSDPYEAKPLFPKVWPTLFAKRATAASSLGQAYFRQGILETFFAEKRLRETGLFDPILLYAHVTTTTQYIV
ncbi:MAG: hypothetical protein AAGI90_06475 [Chlamydiota bacterium]